MPRLYREAPINAIWEGSGNVQALDVLRALERSPEVLEAWFAEMAEPAADNAILAGAIKQLRDAFADTDQIAFRARSLVDQLALTMQAALLVRAGDAAVADGFTRSRLEGQGMRQYGTLPTGLDLDTLLARANPLVTD